MRGRGLARVAAGFTSSRSVGRLVPEGWRVRYPTAPAAGRRRWRDGLEAVEGAAEGAGAASAAPGGQQPRARAGRERGPAGAQVLALLNSPKTYRPEAA
jgi:hypothetical protein